MSFSQICNKYGAVDTSEGTDKTTTHSYGTVYDTLLNPFKDSAQNILEIGFACGASLQVYTEFFTQANVYGIDIQDQCKSEFKQNPRIQMIFGDAKNSSIRNHFSVHYDIIIEDASHQPQDQVQHFIDFSDQVVPGGIYIIEDVNGENLNFLRDRLDSVAKERGFTLQILDLRNQKGRFDDILFVYRRNL